jgi:CRP-like cAMP-binding protein
MRTRNISEGDDIVREGSRPIESCLLLSGLAGRYKLVAGGRRQIVSFHFPGDLPDLQSLTLGTMDHSLGALSPVRVAFIPHDAILKTMDQEKGVRDVLMKLGLIDGSIFREWIANVGRRTALERISHVFCECFVRLRVRGLADGWSFQLLFTQTQLGDATGMSNVHVNRTLQQLRRRELLRTTGRKYEIINWPALRQVADFDPAYLHLRKPMNA